MQVEKPYFVVAYPQEKRQPPMPIMDEELENLSIFATFEEAKYMAESQYLCQHFGYQIFNMNQTEKTNEGI